MQNIFRNYRFIIGFVLASLIFSVSAFAININNTPQGGYLLCANTKTKVVTFPGTLKCPSGSKEILVPGSNISLNTNSEDSSSDNTSKTNSNNGKGSVNCNITYIESHPEEVAKTLEQCSGSQLNTLISELNKSQAKLESDIKLEQDKLSKLQQIATEKANLAKTATGENADAARASAQDAAAAVAEQSAKVSTLMAGIKAKISILTNLVIAIQKKVTS